MIKAFRAWLYKKAFDYVMTEHALSLESCSMQGTRLSFRGKMLEMVDFTEVQFHRSSFNNATFLTCPHEKVTFDACDFGSARFLKSAFGLARFNNSLMHGVDWTGTFSGEVKERVERLASRVGTATDLDGMSVVATKEGVKLQLDEPPIARIKPKKKK